VPILSVDGHPVLHAAGRIDGVGRHFPPTVSIFAHALVGLYPADWAMVAVVAAMFFAGISGAAAGRHGRRWGPCHPGHDPQGVS